MVRALFYFLITFKETSVKGFILQHTYICGMTVYFLALISLWQYFSSTSRIDLKESDTETL